MCNNGNKCSCKKEQTWFEQVREFHVKFQHPHQNTPILLEKARASKRYDWMLEEINEFIEADTVEGQADAMIDLMYFALGTLVEMGVKPEKLFEIVHSANMSKLWEDGEPRFREDGKVIKPAGWVDPEPWLKAEIERQKKAV